MAALSRDEILARKIHGKTERVELEGGGHVVVRGLTRAEARQVDMIENPGDAENFAVHSALVEPKMSLEDVEAWAQNGGSQDFQGIAEAVQRLNLVGKSAGKELTKSPAEQP